MDEDDLDLSIQGFISDGNENELTSSCESLPAIIVPDSQRTLRRSSSFSGSKTPRENIIDSTTGEIRCESREIKLNCLDSKIHRTVHFNEINKNGLTYEDKPNAPNVLYRGAQNNNDKIIPDRSNSSLTNNSNIYKTSLAIGYPERKTSTSTISRPSSSGSTFKLTDEEKHRLACERNLKRLKEVEEESANRELQKQRAAENNQAFQSWLRKKQQEAVTRRRSSVDSRPSSSSSQKSSAGVDNAFNEWMRVKSGQKRKDERLKKLREEELSAKKHTQEQRDAAYQSWLKKKNEEKRLQREIEQLLLSTYKVQYTDKN